MGAAHAERRPRVDGSRTVPHGVDSGREERPLDGHCVGPAATVDEDRLVRLADPQSARLILAVQRDDPKVAAVLLAILTAPHGSGAVPSRRCRRPRSASMTRVPAGHRMARRSGSERTVVDTAGQCDGLVGFEVEANVPEVVDHDGVDAATISAWGHHGPPPTYRIGYGEQSAPPDPERQRQAAGRSELEEAGGLEAQLDQPRIDEKGRIAGWWFGGRSRQSADHTFAVTPGGVEDLVSGAVEVDAVDVVGADRPILAPRPPDRPPERSCEGEPDCVQVAPAR